MRSGLRRTCLAALEARTLAAQGRRSTAEEARSALRVASPDLEDHLEGCPECREAEADLERVKQIALSGDDVLDDVARARVLANLGPTLERLEERLATSGRPAGQRRRWALIAVPAAAALLVGLLAILVVGRERTRVAPMSADESRARPSSVVLGQLVDRLQVPGGTEAQASVGEAVRLIVIGPAELEVRERRADGIRLGLIRGTLIASYERHRGGRLAVETRDAVTHVLGTLFLVSAEDERPTRVAVAHGRVQVTSRAASVQAVRGGQTWSSARGLEPLSPSERELFRRLGPRLEAEEPPPPLSTSRSAPPRGLAPTATSRLLAEKRRPFSSLPPVSSAPPGSAPSAPSAATEPTAAAPSVPASPASRPADPSPAGASETPPPAPAGAATVYRQVERALAAGEKGRARALLEEIVRRWPADPLAQQARYELARAAFDRGEHAIASRYLDQVLVSRGEPALLEPASYLRCRAEVKHGATAAAVDCLTRFRATFSSSPHDEAALVQLIQLAGADCAAVERLARDYLARYPEGRSAKAVRLRGQGCRR